MEGEEDRRRISKKHVAGFAIPWVPLILILLGFPPASRAASDYRDALSKSLLYFEAQRSGRLPHDQRVAWRGNSGLTDGLEQGVGVSQLAGLAICAPSTFLVLIFSRLSLAG